MPANTDQVDWVAKKRDDDSNQHFRRFLINAQNKDSTKKQYVRDGHPHWNLKNWKKNVSILKKMVIIHIRSLLH